MAQQLKTLAVFGATSGIAVETARLFAAEGCALFLAARDPLKLETVKQDLAARGAAVVAALEADLADTARHQELLDAAIEALGSLDGALIAYGTLGDQKQGEQDFKVAAKELRTNFISPVSLLTVLANYFEAERRGVIAVIGSVAGDRGRQSNYIYGSAKGGLAIFLQGLRNRLCRSGVKVVTIKPGFVDTPMTAHLRKNFLFANPAAVARGIQRAMVRGCDVVYLPHFWRLILLVIRHVPEAIFKRLSL